jgi:hypoxanthine phosphoribosyltransferase
MQKLVSVVTKDEIAKGISEVAREISSDYADGEVVLIGVLKGAFIFLSDLARLISIPVFIDFIRVSSYNGGEQSSGKITVTQDIEMDIKDKDVIIVEDILDTGITLSFLVDHLKSFQPKSVKTCALINKTERRETDAQADYWCHLIEKGFLVGYGLDYAERYRDLPEIYCLK